MTGTARLTGYDILVSLTNKKRTDFFSYEDLLEEARNRGLTKESLDKYLEKLKKLGTIYSPRPGVFKLAD